jgi:hypothetical protein
MGYGNLLSHPKPKCIAHKQCGISDLFYSCVPVSSVDRVFGAQGGLTKHEVPPPCFSFLCVHKRENERTSKSIVCMGHPASDWQAGRACTSRRCTVDSVIATRCGKEGFTVLYAHVRCRLRPTRSPGCTELGASSTVCFLTV